MTYRNSLEGLGSSLGWRPIVALFMALGWVQCTSEPPSGEETLSTGEFVSVADDALILSEGVLEDAVLLPKEIVFTRGDAELDPVGPGWTVAGVAKPSETVFVRKVLSVRRLSGGVVRMETEDAPIVNVAPTFAVSRSLRLPPLRSKSEGLELPLGDDLRVRLDRLDVEFAPTLGFSLELHRASLKTLKATIEGPLHVDGAVVSTLPRATASFSKEWELGKSHQVIVQRVGPLPLGLQVDTTLSAEVRGEATSEGSFEVQGLGEKNVFLEAGYEQNAFRFGGTVSGPPLSVQVPLPSGTGHGKLSLRLRARVDVSFVGIASASLRSEVRAQGEGALCPAPSSYSVRGDVVTSGEARLALPPFLDARSEKELYHATVETSGTWTPPLPVTCSPSSTAPSLSEAPSPESRP